MVSVLRLVVDWIGHRSNLFHRCPHLWYFTKRIWLYPSHTSSLPHAYACLTLHGFVHQLSEKDWCG